MWPVSLIVGVAVAGAVCIVVFGVTIVMRVERHRHVRLMREHLPSTSLSAYRRIYLNMGIGSAMSQSRLASRNDVRCSGENHRLPYALRTSIGKTRGSRREVERSEEAQTNDNATARVDDSRIFIQPLPKGRQHRKGRRARSKPGPRSPLSAIIEFTDSSNDDSVSLDVLRPPPKAITRDTDAGECPAEEWPLPNGPGKRTWGTVDTGDLPGEGERKSEDNDDSATATEAAMGESRHSQLEEDRDSIERLPTFTFGNAVGKPTSHGYRHGKASISSCRASFDKKTSTGTGDNDRVSIEHIQSPPLTIGRSSQRSSLPSQPVYRRGEANVVLRHSMYAHKRGVPQCLDSAGDGRDSKHSQPQCRASPMESIRVASRSVLEPMNEIRLNAPRPLALSTTESRKRGHKRQNCVRISNLPIPDGAPRTTHLPRMIEQDEEDDISHSRHIPGLTLLSRPRSSGTTNPSQLLEHDADAASTAGYGDAVTADRPDVFTDDELKASAFIAHVFSSCGVDPPFNWESPTTLRHPGRRSVASSEIDSPVLPSPLLNSSLFHTHNASGHSPLPPSSQGPRLLSPSPMRIRTHRDPWALAGRHEREGTPTHRPTLSASASAASVEIPTLDGGFANAELHQSPSLASAAEVSQWEDDSVGESSPEPPRLLLVPQRRASVSAEQQSHSRESGRWSKPKRAGPTRGTRGVGTPGSLYDADGFLKD